MKADWEEAEVTASNNIAGSAEASRLEIKYSSVIKFELTTETKKFRHTSKKAEQPLERFYASNLDLLSGLHDQLKMNV